MGAILALLLALNLLVYMTRYALAGVLPLVEESLVGISKAQLGYLASAFVLLYLLAAPPFGLLGDRVRRFPLLALGISVSGLATAAGGLTISFGLLLMTRALVGIGQASFVSIAPAVLSDLYPASRRASALGVFSMGQPVGTALSYVAGGGLVAFGLGWQGVLLVVGLPTALVGLMALRLDDPPRGARDASDAISLERYLDPELGWRRYLPLLRNRSYLINTLAMSANSFAMGGLAYWMPTYLHSARGIPLATASLGFGLVTAGTGVAGSVGGGVLADRVARRFAGGHALLCALAMLAAVPLFYLFFAVKQPLLVWSVMGVCELLLFASASPALTIIMNVTEPRVRASANAFNMVAIHLLGEMFAPVILGAFADRATITAGLEAAAIAIGISGVFWLLCVPFIAGDQRRAQAAVGG